MLFKTQLNILKNKKINYVCEVLLTSVMIILIIFAIISAENQEIDFIYANF